MSAFNISFMRVDRDEDPTIAESFTRAVDWPLLPREGKGLDLGEGTPLPSRALAVTSTATRTSSSGASCLTTSGRRNCANWPGAQARFRSAVADVRLLAAGKPGLFLRPDTS